MWSNEVIKAEGKRQFKQNYWPCVVAAILLGLTDASVNMSTYSAELEESGHIVTSMVTSFIPSIFMILLAVFLLYPLAVSARRFFLVNMLKPADLNEIKYSFTNNYTNIVFVMFMKNLFIFLWTLLLIIPGIIKAYEYRMVEYLLAEDSSMDYKTALDKSREMMRGNKMDAFIYDLSFIGWFILTVLTAGILGLFWVAPYKYSSDAALYIFIRNNSNVMFGGNGDNDNYAENDVNYTDNSRSNMADGAGNGYNANGSNVGNGSYSGGTTSGTVGEPVVKDVEFDVEDNDQ